MVEAIQNTQQQQLQQQPAVQLPVSDEKFIPESAISY